MGIIYDKLYSFQKQAAQICRRYYEAEEVNHEYCLMEMPTGSGKTVLMAYLAEELNCTKSTLILTPRKTLRKQAFDEIKSNIYQKMKLNQEFYLPYPPVPVEEVSSVKCLIRVLDEEIGKGPKVFIMTIQLLTALYVGYKENERDSDISANHPLERLKAIVSLVVFDEGHYEPSYLWSQVISYLNCRTVLLSATPYRNDYKYFKIKEEYTLSLRLNKFQWDEKYIERRIRNQISINDVEDEKGLLRSVSFQHYEDVYEELPERSKSTIDLSNLDPTNFVKLITSIYTYMTSNLGLTQTKAIIKCSSFEVIEQIRQAFVDLDIQSFLCIHENYKTVKIADKSSIDSHISATVPDKNREDTTIYYVHQFKLLEGIDDNRFRFIFVYDEISNVRNIIQQIGRVIRKSDKFKNEVAYFFDRRDHHHKAKWEQYLRIISEENVQIVSKPLLDTTTTKSNKSYYYVDGDFRLSLDYAIVNNQLNLMADVLIEKRVNSYAINPEGFQIETFLDAYHRDSVKNDRDLMFPNGPDLIFEKSLIYHLSDPNADLEVLSSCPKIHSVYLLIYRGLVPCESFTDKFAFESSINIVVFVITLDNRLFSTNSISRFINQKKKIFEVVDKSHLRKLLMKSDDMERKYKKLSLVNGNIGVSTLRSKVISAYSIEQTVPSFDDFSSIYTTVEAQWDSKFFRKHRYIGFKNGRVCDDQGKRVPLRHFLHWVNEINNGLSDGLDNTALLNRYASFSKRPSKSDNRIPLNILIETDSINGKYAKKTVDGSQEVFFEFDDICCEIYKEELITKKSKKDSYFFWLSNSNDKAENRFKVYINFPSEESKTDKYILSSPTLVKAYPRIRELSKYNSIISQLNATQDFILVLNDLETVYFSNSYYKPSIRKGKDFYDNSNLKNSIIGVPDFKMITSEKGQYKDKTIIEEFETGSLFNLVASRGYVGEIELSNQIDIGFPDYIICDDMGCEIADFILGYNNPKRVVMIHAKAENRSIEDDVKAGCSVNKIKDVIVQAQKNVGYLAMYNDLKPQKADSWYGFWKSENCKVPRIIKCPEDERDSKKVWEGLRRIINSTDTKKEVWLLLANLFSRKAWMSGMGVPDSLIITGDTIETSIHDDSTSSLSQIEEEIQKKKLIKANSYQATLLISATASLFGSIGATMKIFCNE